MFKRRIEQPTDGETLICTRCFERKPANDTSGTGFSKASKSSASYRTYGGYAMPCRECNKKRCKARGHTESDRMRQSAQRATDEYRALARNQKRKWYAEPENRAAWNAFQRERHAAKTPEEREAWKAGCRTYYAAHKPEALAKMRQYRATEQGHAVKVTANQRRKARMRGVPGTLTTAEWRAILKAHANTCVYCGFRGSSRKLTVDHVVPLVQGGQHVAANVVPACLECNCRKQDSTVEEFMQRIGRTLTVFYSRLAIAGREIASQ